MELQRLQTLEKDFLQNKYKLENMAVNHYPELIIKLENKINELEKDIQFRNENSIDFVFKCSKGVTLNERKVAGEYLLSLVNSEDKEKGKLIGSINGFDIHFHSSSFGYESVTLEKNYNQIIELSNDEIGSIIRLENGIKNLDSILESTKTKLENTKKNLETAKIEIEKEFDYTDKIKGIKKRIKFIEKELTEKEVKNNDDYLIDEEEENREEWENEPEEELEGIEV